MVETDTMASASAFRFLGIRVNTLTVPELNEIVARAVRGSAQTVIACHNLHSLYIFHHDAKMRSFHDRADYVHIDGMGIVLLGCLLGHPLRRQHRVTYLDWLTPLLEQARSQKWRVFYVGMRGSICTQAQAAVAQNLPGLEFETAHWDIENVPEGALRKEVLKKINDCQPHILFVGLGQPRQEHWIFDNLSNISATVVLPCGAAMDYVAGAAISPPRWAGRLGLEWFCRLISEPRHLWRRYLIEPWYVLRLFCLEMVSNPTRAK